MRDSSYSSVNQENGNVTYDGPLEVMKGDHSHMPSRNESYLPGDERGHVNASSLGGINARSNVVAQHHDLNHGGYRSVEMGETKALNDGASIHSEKTAIVDGKVGDRPTTFTVNDSVTYRDGHVETVHHSFTNESYATQQAWNEQSAALPGTFDAPNPGDSLRASMTTEEYADLMERTDAELPNLTDDYAPADFSGVPASSHSISMDSGEAALGNSEIGGTSISSDGGLSADFGDGGSSVDAAGDGISADTGDSGVSADSGDGASADGGDGGASADSGGDGASADPD